MSFFLRYVVALFLLTILLGCPRSGRPSRYDQPDADVKPTKRYTQKSVVKMTKINGVYQIPAEVDGVEMHFIFDTGAGIISISETEAIFLYKQGRLTNDDITGSGQFTDATGAISEGTLINLKTLKIGNRVLRNIRASVVHNLQAPLLLGQSALERFGKVSIDYQNMEIVFE